MHQTPDANPLGPIDRETFDTLRKDPGKLEAHLDGLLAAVHDRMTKPFQEKRPLSYRKFPKAPPVDMHKLVPMPGMGKKPEQAATTAQPADSAPVQPVPPAPETAHPPAPKSEKSLPLSTIPKGTLIHQSVVEAPRGVVQNDLPNFSPSVPLHTENLNPDPAPKSKAKPIVSQEAPKPVVPELKIPQKTDPDAVKKRFEDRQAGLNKLFKDKGNLT
jgi:hypothetical protein